MRTNMTKEEIKELFESILGYYQSTPKAKKKRITKTMKTYIACITAVWETYEQKK